MSVEYLRLSLVSIRDRKNNPCIYFLYDLREILGGHFDRELDQKTKDEISILLYGKVEQFCIRTHGRVDYLPSNRKVIDLRKRPLEIITSSPESLVTCSSYP